MNDLDGQPHYSVTVFEAGKRIRHQQYPYTQAGLERAAQYLADESHFQRDYIGLWVFREANCEPEEITSVGKRRNMREWVINWNKPKPTERVTKIDHKLLELLVKMAHGNTDYEKEKSEIDQLIEMGYARVLPQLGNYPVLAQITIEGGEYLKAHPGVEGWPDGHLSTPLLWHFRLKR